MVSIEIGAGTIISGDFSTIDWANNSYFIKTETDPSGGTDYTITGISQLLSVPYALHAKTAEKLSGNVTETDPVFNASPAASVTDAGSGSIITNEERKRWNNAIPDTIMHPENGIYEGGLIGSFQTYQTVYTEGNESTKRKHVLVFSVPSNGSIEQRFSYVDEVYSASGLSLSLEDQSRMVLTKEFDYTRKPYDKSYTIYIKLYIGETLYLSASVSPENPATEVTDTYGHTLNISLISEGTVRITLDRIDPLEYHISYVTQSYGYFPYANVDDFSGQETKLHYKVMNYGIAKANFTVVVRDCSQSMSIVSAKKFILESKETTDEVTTNLYFPNLTSYTGSINLLVDLISPNGLLFDEVQVFFYKVAANE